MSKYITHFQTEAAYQSALPTLNLPNVSLVDELNEVHYHRALYNAKTGDICLYDVAEGQKIVVTAENWNLTDYPTASYPIVGVAIGDETTIGIVLMSIYAVGPDGENIKGNSGSDDRNIALMPSFNGGTAFNSLPKYNTQSNALNDLNGDTNTSSIMSVIENYDTTYNTSNFTDGWCHDISMFHTEGTIAGDWYIPSYGEFAKVINNKTLLQQVCQKIYNASTDRLCYSPTNIFDSNSMLCSTFYSSSTTWSANLYALTTNKNTLGQQVKARLFTKL